MKKLLLVMCLLIFCGTVRETRASLLAGAYTRANRVLYYKYLHSVSGNGAKMRNSSVAKAFNENQKVYKVYIYNVNENISFVVDDSGSFIYFSYTGTNDDIRVYEGPNMEDGLDASGWGAATMQRILLLQAFDVFYDPNNSVRMRVYFNSDYSRMNIKVSTSGITHVFELADKPESQTAPTEFY